MKAREFRIFDRAQLHRVSSLLARMMVSDKKPLLVSVEPYSAQRTDAQNRRYWQVLNELADVEVEGRRYSAEVWHEYLKIRFIGAEDLVLPDGKMILKPLSSTGLNVQQFFIYLDNVENEAAKYGVILDDTPPLRWRSKASNETRRAG